jgi:hypothetical protein
VGAEGAGAIGALAQTGEITRVFREFPDRNPSIGYARRSSHCCTNDSRETRGRWGCFRFDYECDSDWAGNDDVRLESHFSSVY